MAYAVTEAASPDVQSDNVGNIGESDVTKSAHNIIDRHVKGLKEPLAFLLNPISRRRP